MAKRFEDTEKYRKGFMRGLPAAYKLFWDYICLDCNHAGIWEIDIEVAALRLGIKLEYDKALELFNADEIRIQELAGKKWFIRPFISFQYGNLKSDVAAHKSVLSILEKEGIRYPFETLIEPLPNPCKRVMDMDKDMDKDKSNDKVKATVTVSDFDSFWKAYPRKVGKDKALEAWKKKKPPLEAVLGALAWQINTEDWRKEGGTYIPHPATYLNQGRWQDEPPTAIPGSAAAKSDNHARCKQCGMPLADVVRDGKHKSVCLSCEAAALEGA